MIPPGGYLLVWADNQPVLNAPDRPDLHVNFQLSAKGEAIGLFAPDGTPIDTVTFGPQTTDVSEGRCPDGGPNRIQQLQPTPRGSNRCIEIGPRLEWRLTSAGMLHLEWDSVIGTSYSVEAVERLSAAGWTALAPGTPATGTRMTLEVPLDPGRDRFLRLRVGP